MPISSHLMNHGPTPFSYHQNDDELLSYDPAPLLLSVPLLPNSPSPYRELSASSMSYQPRYDNMETDSNNMRPSLSSNNLLSLMNNSNPANELANDLQDLHYSLHDSQHHHFDTGANMVPNGHNIHSHEPPSHYGFNEDNHVHSMEGMMIPSQQSSTDASSSMPSHHTSSLPYPNSNPSSSDRLETGHHTSSAYYEDPNYSAYFSSSLADNRSAATTSNHYDGGISPSSNISAATGYSLASSPMHSPYLPTNMSTTSTPTPIPMPATAANTYPTMAYPATDLTRSASSAIPLAPGSISYQGNEEMLSTSFPRQHSMPSQLREIYLARRNSTGSVAPIMATPAASSHLNGNAMVATAAINALPVLPPSAKVVPRIGKSNSNRNSLKSSSNRGKSTSALSTTISNKSNGNTAASSKLNGITPSPTKLSVNPAFSNKPIGSTLSPMNANSSITSLNNMNSMNSMNPMMASVATFAAIASSPGAVPAITANTLPITSSLQALTLPSPPPSPAQIPGQNHMISMTNGITHATAAVPVANGQLVTHAVSVRSTTPISSISPYATAIPAMTPISIPASPAYTVASAASRPSPMSLSATNRRGGVFTFGNESLKKRRHESNTNRVMESRAT